MKEQKKLTKLKAANASLADVYVKQAEVIRPDVHSVLACRTPAKLARMKGRVGRCAEED